MEWLAFFVSLAALGLSFWALKRTGGIGEMKKESESFRRKSADILDRLEKKVRGNDKGGEKDQAPIKWEES